MKAFGLLLALLILTTPAAEAQLRGADIGGSPPELVRAKAYSIGASTVPVAVGTVVFLAGDQPAERAMGLGLVAAGLALGPSIGSLYLHDERRALIGTALRSAGLMAFGVGFGLGFVADTRDSFGLTASSVLISASVVLIPYGLAFNFLTLNNSAREFEVAMAPSIDRESGAMVPALVFRF